MKINFGNGLKGDVKIEKITKKYTYLYCYNNTMRYKANNLTNEILDTNNQIIKGIYLEKEKIK